MLSNWAKLRGARGGGRGGRGRGRGRGRGGGGGRGGGAGRASRDEVPRGPKRKRDDAPQPPRPPAPAPAKKSSKNNKRKNKGEAPKSRPNDPFPEPSPAAEGAGGVPYLTPSDDAYGSVLERSYKGLVYEPAASMPARFHGEFRSVLAALKRDGFFQYDVVQAGGVRCSRTFVRRTLVGEPGITYKYLGLRIFAHPWSGPSSTPLLRRVAALNSAMRERSDALLEASGMRGRSDFNLTLINYMEPLGRNASLGLKPEADYGMGPVSVSWHADSSLEDFSTIGVYHLTEGAASSCDWRVAVRVSPHAGDRTTPPLVLPTASRDAYYLLGSFNHHHQHAVLAGSTGRFSSTHRVALRGEDTLESAERAAAEALRSADAGGEFTFEGVRAEQAALDTLEFEWIRQYWAQGAEHDARREFWQRPMRRLERSWRRLEARTRATVDAVLAGEAPASCRGLLLNVLARRKAQREAWAARLADRVYRKRIAAPYQPVPGRPSFEKSRAMPEDLAPVLAELGGGGAGGGKKKRARKK